MQIHLETQIHHQIVILPCGTIKMHEIFNTSMRILYFTTGLILDLIKKKVLKKMTCISPQGIFMKLTYVSSNKCKYIWKYKYTSPTQIQPKNTVNETWCAASS